MATRFNFELSDSDTRLLFDIIDIQKVRTQIIAETSTYDKTQTEWHDRCVEKIDKLKKQILSGIV